VPPGKNASFMVVHLGKGVGRLKTRLELSTSHGTFPYDVTTDSVVNALRAKPLTSGRVPLGVEYRQPITVYNPYDAPLHVLEVYTSNAALRLDLFAEGEPTAGSVGSGGVGSGGGGSGDASSSPSGGAAVRLRDSASWVIQPRETKTVMTLLARGDEPGVIRG
jgi:hypothetical protein